MPGYFGKVKTEWDPIEITRSTPASQARGPGARGLGQRATMGGKSVRHRKIARDTILGITKPTIRRLARRGGVIRMSADVYGEARLALKAYLEKILKDVVTYVEYRNAKTVNLGDVLHSLRRHGRTLWGFEREALEAEKNIKQRTRRADRITL
ncbi:hypothetical protein ACHAQJ_004028 [Trichoderma viride]